MAITSSRVTVADTATLVASGGTGDTSGVDVAVSNPSGGATVDLGAVSVTSGTGFRLTGGSTVSLHLNQGEILYGIVASSTQVVDVIKQGVDA